MSTIYWNYFLSLERDFIRTLDFVEIASANASTFGDNYAKLILAAGSEIDVICKALCEVITPGSDPKNINDYKAIITNKFPLIHESKVLVERARIEIEPWLSWNPQSKISPDWWSAYNNVKHNRVSHFTLASQKNALAALCGLLVINRYYHRVAGMDGAIKHPQPFPSLLDTGTPDIIVAGGTRTLPGL